MAFNSETNQRDIVDDNTQAPLDSLELGSQQLPVEPAIECPSPTCQIFEDQCFDGEPLSWVHLLDNDADIS